MNYLDEFWHAIVTGFRWLLGLKKPQQNRRRSSDRLYDVGEIPEVSTSQQYVIAQHCLFEFLTWYFPNTFKIPMSEGHKLFIGKLQAIFDGETTTDGLGLPRNSGKDSITTRAILWAILTGRMKYIRMIRASENVARSTIKTLQTEILYNERLREDWGRELACLLHAGEYPARLRAQTYLGCRTMACMKHDKICFGRLDGVNSSNGCIEIVGAKTPAAGRTHHIMGANDQVTDTIRSQATVIVDPGSGYVSESDVLRTIRSVKDHVYSAAPGAARFLVATASAHDSVNDLLLSEWNCRRISLVKRWPDWMEGWDEYLSLRKLEQNSDQCRDRSTRFVEDNFDELHEGAELFWPDAYNEDEYRSALQLAMDLRHQNERHFAAEYQNRPFTT